MRTRKELKQEARSVLKRHYVMLVVLCAISIFYATEFSGVSGHAQTLYAVATGQQDFFNVNTFKGNSTEHREKILQDLIDDNIKAGRDDAAKRLQEYKKDFGNSEVLGRRHGAFASIVNNFSSGQMYITFATAIHSVVHSHKMAARILIVLILMFNLFIYIFLKNVYRAVMRRMFLEARTYEKLPVSHMLHFRFVKRWVRASLTMFLVSVLETLWWLTIVGGFIKHFSYYQVPFIVAENPDIKPRDAVNLSRRMMDGHKWECCKLELSFIGWYILGGLTFGVTEVLFSVPYEVATFSAYYADLRSLSKAQGVEGTNRLNDIYLFEKAPLDRLEVVYNDIVEQQKYVDDHPITLGGKRKFFAENFGIWIGSLPEKIEYEEVDSRRKIMREEKAVMKGRVYPQRLSRGWQPKDTEKMRNINYLRTYTIWSLIAIFFIFSFVGWAWEVSIHLVQDGAFVNRGALHGPWLPIYGGGVAAITVLLAKFRSRPPLEIASIIVLCGALEFTTSLVLEMTKGMRWWDYTGYFLNLDGRICAEGLMVFAIGGSLAVYLIIPVLDAMLIRVRLRYLAPVCLVLLFTFAGDTVFSHYHPNVGDGITDYDAYREEARIERMVESAIRS